MLKTYTYVYFFTKPNKNVKAAYMFAVRHFDGSRRETSETITYFKHMQLISPEKNISFY